VVIYQCCIGGNALNCVWLTATKYEWGEYELNSLLLCLSQILSLGEADNHWADSSQQWADCTKMKEWVEKKKDPIPTWRLQVTMEITSPLPYYIRLGFKVATRFEEQVFLERVFQDDFFGYTQKEIDSVTMELQDWIEKRKDLTCFAGFLVKEKSTGKEQPIQPSCVF
jgi:hypothetical protein